MSLFDKVWNAHVVAEQGGGVDLLHVDRHLLHDLSGMKVLAELRGRGLSVRNPELTLATPDHGVSTSPSRERVLATAQSPLLRGLREETSLAGIRCFDIDEDGQGIVHVTGPELGFSLPGSSVVCGDSHTCTHGGLGALAFGVGRTEIVHVLATQTLYQKRPKRMRITYSGQLNPFVSPKDLILHTIGHIGAAAGTGYAIEYAGDTIEHMSIEGRLTICNLSIELGAKIGMIAPDEKTFSFLSTGRFSPSGEHWTTALEYWKTLKSDDDADFDVEHFIDASIIGPQITWGTSPQHVMDVGDLLPDHDESSGRTGSHEVSAALDYMGLPPGAPIVGIPVDYVFIGSCTNGRLEDLREAASVASGRKVAPNVQAWVVPGSQKVKRAAEAEGLDAILTAAGFHWREPGCSMCLAANGETVRPHGRSVSTTNRNFEGRQGPDARTHLASPAMAAAAAIAGVIIDVRKLAN